MIDGLKNLGKSALTTIGLVASISLLVYFILAYYVTGFPNGTSGPITDGLGRLLYATPTIAHLLIEPDRMWAGFDWFISDIFVFLLLGGISALCFKLQFSIQPNVATSDHISEIESDT